MIFGKKLKPLGLIQMAKIGAIWSMFELQVDATPLFKNNFVCYGQMAKDNEYLFAFFQNQLLRLRIQ